MLQSLLSCLFCLHVYLNCALGGSILQIPLLEYSSKSDSNVSIALFNDLEELSRIVDISYCVGITGTGIQKPFLCASRCQDFEDFELVTVRRL